MEVDKEQNPAKYVLKKAIVQWLYRYDVLTFLSFPQAYWIDFTEDLTNCLVKLFDENYASDRLLLPGLIYMNKYIEQRQILEPEGFSIFHLLITSFLVCFKFWSDMSIICNDSFSKIAGIPIQKINQMEINFLETLDYSLFLTEKEVSKFTQSFINSAVDPYVHNIVGNPVEIGELVDYWQV
eukprot:TRINITY_DN8667_c0_g1_i1.p1 TRINITY_DN8667_c0_g1~~TRINITY_DN8667_c0_g1_i1.p1  ORF type:complete len:182 (-),score=28.48 TRINITY_DN8667_c0_g1_i1:107-652(-)